MIPIATLNNNQTPGVLRNIASAVGAPGNGSGGQSNGTDTTMNMREYHVNTSGVALTSLTIVYSGWYLTTVNESIAPNDLTVTSAIEYPVGTYTQVTWGGTSTTVTAGTDVLSDVIPVAIPNGAAFYIRTFISVSGGQKWAKTSNINTSLELGESGVGLADKTMGGIFGNQIGTSVTSVTIATGSKTWTTQAALGYAFGDHIFVADQANSNNFCFGSVTAYSGTTLTVSVTQIGGSGTISAWNTYSAADTTQMKCSGILSYASGINKISLLGIGDSIIWGSGDGAYDSSNNSAWIGRATTGNCPYVSCAVVGTTLANQVLANKMQYRNAWIRKLNPSHIICDYGVNDVGTGLSTMQANLQTIWGMLRAGCRQLLHTTIGPRAASTDSYYTVANQTANAQFSGSGATGNQVSAYIAGLPAPLSGYVNNVGVLTSLADSGTWLTGDSTPGSDVLSSDTWTISGTPSTTVFRSNSTRSSNPNYYSIAQITFTSGVLNGTTTSVSAYSLTNGQFTVPALSQAPSAGDTFTASPSAIRVTVDGLHPAILTNATVSGILGGQAILRDNLIPSIQSWTKVNYT